MATLNDLANKLQTFIVDQQTDAHSTSNANFNMSKYNNLKLSMDESVNYPHIIIRIGISEATYNIKEMVKEDGGLGPDEKYIRKWLGNYSVAFDLNEIYNQFTISLSAHGKHKFQQQSEDYAIEIDANGKIKRVYEARAAVTDSKKRYSEQRKREIKSELKNFLNAKKRKLK